MRVLGVDPGSRHLGWGVVEARGSRFLHVASGTLNAPEGELASRLVFLAQGLRQVLRETSPAACAIERVFHGKNVHSALTLAHARGVALLVTGEAGLWAHEYTAGQIKQAAVGRGRATKEQVQYMVQMMLGQAAANTISSASSFDTTDALAAAICHLQRADSLHLRARAASKATTAIEAP